MNFGMLFPNWKTTALGIIAAAIQLYMGGMNWKNALFSATLAMLGIAAKDANVTGGTVANPK